MNSPLIRLFAVALGLVVLLPGQKALADGPELSPFRGMRAVAKGLEVQVVDDTWYALESVAGVDTATLLREAERLCGKNAWKRLTEDLPALLGAMGHEVGDTVDLKVRDLTTKELRELPAVKMTRENRQRLARANRSAQAPVLEAAAAAPNLSAADARADLAELP